MAVASLILGIVSLVISWIPVIGWIVGLICGVVAVILGVLARKKQPEKKGMAVAGMVLGIIGIVFSVIVIVACGAVLGAGAKALNESGINLKDMVDQAKDAVE